MTVKMLKKSKAVKMLKKKVTSKMGFKPTHVYYTTPSVISCLGPTGKKNPNGAKVLHPTHH